MKEAGFDKLSRSAGLLFVAAMASSIPTFWYYLVGEEGILISSSLEMAQRGDWLRLWLVGIDHRHGVFANWLIIPLATAIGWDKAPGIARAVMVLSTAAAGFVLYVLVRRLYRDAALAALAAVVCVTFGDVLLYRGWLAYRDPLFGMLVFAAIAALWIAARARRAIWLSAVVLCSALAFLTKGLIAYVYVGAAVFVMLWRAQERKFLLRPSVVALAVVTLGLPFIWFYLVVGDQTQGGRMTAEIAAKLVPEGFLAYIGKLAGYPLETLLRLAPVSVLAMYAIYRQPRLIRDAAADVEWRTALAIALLAFLPFWLAPQSHFRYLMPIVPLFALVFAVILYQSGEATVRLALKWLWAAVVLKLLMALVAFPYYQQHYRGENHALAAQEILERTLGYPLYANNTTATGLSVSAYVNFRRLPQPALRVAPENWDNGFVIAYDADARLGRVAAKYRLGGDDLYLLCRGAACDAKP